MIQEKKPDGNSEGQKISSPPAISLPKGGGAIRGIGEKFAANPVTGTGSMTVPIATSPGRSGFGPQLALSYDSGAGNGPFGFGWSLSLPSITRKTDKGLPQYDDAGESDVFLPSRAEDLVPEFKKDADGHWIIEDGNHVIVDEPRTVDGVTYRVRRYRPRIEGLFARIERWTNVADPRDVHWRSISKDNVLTLYGKDADSRIVDPDDSGRIFSWLICETRDDKGNAIIYQYKAEDGTKVDLTRAHERNRGDRNDPRRRVNRYIKHIYYGNRISLLDDAGRRPLFLTAEQIENAGWMFEVVFDYGEHDASTPKPDDAGPWIYRDDPFSSYRAGFEVRTCRLCQRVLMFHHFEHEEDVGNNCLVRSTDFTYSHEQDPTDARNPIYSFLLSVTQSGYKRNNGSYLKRSLPPLEFEYSQPIVQDTVQEVDAQSLENLPVGLDGAAYQWTDLHGEGIPGILTEQAGGWFYKRNLSPINVKRDNGVMRTEAKFAPVEVVAVKPNLALAAGAQFMDLAGDGQPDLVVLDDPMPGLYEHDGDAGWQPFRPFTARLNRDTRDPNLKFIDLDGDGHADVLISEDNAFIWHPSLAEEGFGPARRIAQAPDEEKGPRLVSADGTQSIYLADMSGDGLTDLVRLRNGEVCYWPNLGYGRFGAKVTMDHAPHFDHPDQFDQQRIRLADIDGTGTTDIMYLHSDGVRLYFNQSGNSWSEPQILRVFPRVDDLVSITPLDLLGNGTACLVWSSPLPGDAGRQMRYVDLMGGHKPYLLVRTINNLGAETHVRYAPSTKFYLQDKRDGKPWITRLPFPVHVVERVETYDYISRNRFVTRYAYHHGYFDGIEREFHGFGMVEQFDTEEFAVLSASEDFPTGDNIDAASHVPPVHTKTWFHTGAFLDRHHISRQFESEYYRELGLNDQEFQALLLPDTTLPTGLTLEEEREACRALKGMMLRQEVYADDTSPDSPEAMIQRARTPYTVVEQDFTIRPLQPRASNRHGVFFTHPREVIAYHYERKPADPRIAHILTLEVDDVGNVLKEAAIGYGRRDRIRVVDVQGNVTEAPNPGLNALEPRDQAKQTQLLITYTENRVTNAVDGADDYRTPLPCETRTYEFTGFKPENNADRFSFDEWTRNDFALPASATEIPYEQTADNVSTQKRLIEHIRTLYRPNDLGVAQNDPLALLPLGTVESLALPGESYQLAFTPGLLAHVYRRPLDTIQPPSAPEPEELLPDLADVLPLGPTGEADNRGGYVDLDDNGHWWMPSGRMLFSPDRDNPAAELEHARKHFFLPHRFRDPFGNETTVAYDNNASDPSRNHNLLVVETRDPLGNVVTVKTTDDDGQAKIRNDYRVLQPYWLTDPNGNRTRVAFDALGMVVGTAVMGKAPPAPVEGDSLEEFEADLTQAQIGGFYDVEEPHMPAPSLLKGATTRIIYDLDRFQRTREAHPEDPTQWLPVYVTALARETHVSDPLPPQGLKIQISFSYSDGFGREIQQKIQAEPGPIVEGGPVVSPRWVGSGWTIFNNKGKPVRQYEPFFSPLPEKRHRFEFANKVGVSPVFFYDPVERIVATLHPNHTWEKVVFDPWRQETWDVNDTVTVADPKADPDVGDFFRRLPEAEYMPAWHALRTDATHASEFTARYPDPADRANETHAAAKAAVHDSTPSVAHADALGRTCLTVAHNKFKFINTPPTDPPTEEFYETHVIYDIEGNERVVIDAKQRVVMRYDYDMLGNRIHQASMEAGERWMLNDVAGNPIRAWDSRTHDFIHNYDALRRPMETKVKGGDGSVLLDNVYEKIIYGEDQSLNGKTDQELNLRGKPFLHYDTAGKVRFEEYDFKDNPRQSRRWLAANYKSTPDWNIADPDSLLEPEDFSTETKYDALNRPVTLTTPDGSIIRPIYNEANLLERLEVNLRNATATTVFVTNIDFNAKGQRTLIQYSNGAETTYEYDPLTFRLIHLKTTRPAGLNGLASQLFSDPTVVQDLRYTYDPADNITRIQDAALQIVTHNGEQIEPVSSYTYDAIYRLIEATGREHIGQTAHDFNPPNGNYRDYPFVGRRHPNDPQALRNYAERYEYDDVGNFDVMRHFASGGSWTQRYDYEEDSLIEAGKQSNRLTRTTVDNGFRHIEPYTYDPHGNMATMFHLSLMQWDFRDQLQATAQQVVNSGTPETTYYVYDAGGQRVRKVTERQAPAGQTPTRKEERIYLGGFEIHRKYKNDGDAIELERETLHIMDDQQRIALVETRTQGSDPAPEQLIRYQFGNHLGSASLELDDQAKIISYEEHCPYGSSTYQAMGSQTETPKRYRYTGKERDEENGFYYHGARYYAPWLRRWESCDPLAMADSLNLYEYALSSPTNEYDLNGFQSRRPREPEDADIWGDFFDNPEAIHEEIDWETEDLIDELKWDAPTDRLWATDEQVRLAHELLVNQLGDPKAFLEWASWHDLSSQAHREYVRPTRSVSVSAPKIPSVGSHAQANRAPEGPLIPPPEPYRGGSRAAYWAYRQRYARWAKKQEQRWYEERAKAERPPTPTTLVLVELFPTSIVLFPYAHSIIYLRVNPQTGGEYAGRAMTIERFRQRIREHNRNRGVQHQFSILQIIPLPWEGRTRRGPSGSYERHPVVEFSEETHIRRMRERGMSENRSPAMSEERYRSAGGNVRPKQPPPRPNAHRTLPRRGR